ncbi:uncharacterized protein DUF2500 [Humibacillus xanthopallidus]|uniref:Uncharacterized protein DUF2500 n=1 Tax=Humibacillus xanthopallidus TaxID=412689 RepID=A0A543PX20_9MICO|nr:DUF2500 domain-containing protein [Humibacillus xanthopallidus]TQN48606.1 uncharacterized protein DUF2500 [Humibacillus xanthopallidus]
MVTDEFGPLTPDMSGPPTVFLLLFGLIFTLVIAGFVTVVVKGLSQWRANEASPLRSVDAMVVSRRTDVHRRPGTVGAPTDGSGTMAMGSTSPSSSTTYFVTFEELSGERRELQMSGTEFGQMAEGDRGHLIHQGTRYKGFTRQHAADGPPL